MRIGITGQSGFIGTHLYNYLGTIDEVKIIPFKDEYFQDKDVLDEFVKKCDAIVHLAALNRHGEEGIIYKTNVDLIEKLINSVKRTNSAPHILMSSSTQESRDNEYGRSKKKGRELFIEWANNNHSNFTGLVIPNVFGPFGKPFYNSVVSTFSYQIAHNQEPEIDVDAKMNLIYVQDLVELIYKIMKEQEYKDKYLVDHIGSAKVSEILKKLNNFHKSYAKKGVFPDLSNYFDLCLFNTYRSYLEKSFFPFDLELHSDDRGSFVETVRASSKGQTSFSTTKAGITRGNHFHIRIVERFCVLKGKALIQLRKIGTDEIIEYELSGKQPAFVDMPVWYTHNIKNIGDEELYTLFWINGFYDTDNLDTYYEKV